MVRRPFTNGYKRKAGKASNGSKSTDLEKKGNMGLLTQNKPAAVNHESPPFPQEVEVADGEQRKTGRGGRREGSGRKRKVATSKQNKKGVMKKQNELFVEEDVPYQSVEVEEGGDLPNYEYAARPSKKTRISDLAFGREEATINPEILDGEESLYGPESGQTILGRSLASDSVTDRNRSLRIPQVERPEESDLDELAMSPGPNVSTPKKIANLKPGYIDPADLEEDWIDDPAGEILASPLWTAKMLTPTFEVTSEKTMSTKEATTYPKSPTTGEPKEARGASNILARPDDNRMNITDLAERRIDDFKGRTISQKNHSNSASRQQPRLPMTSQPAAHQQNVKNVANNPSVNNPYQPISEAFDKSRSSTDNTKPSKRPRGRPLKRKTKIMPHPKATTSNPEMHISSEAEESGPDCDDTSTTRLLDTRASTNSNPPPQIRELVLRTDMTLPTHSRGAMSSTDVTPTPQKRSAQVTLEVMKLQAKAAALEAQAKVLQADAWKLRIQAQELELSISAD